MDEIKLAIVENEDAWADLLERYISRYSEESGVSVRTQRFRDGYDIAENYEGGFDIILMDIEMTLMSGMEAAEQIRKSDPEVTIIFITMMAQYAIQGYKVNAMDYILKPIKYEGLQAVLNKAISARRREGTQYLTIPLRNGIRKLCLRDILWVESLNHRMKFHTTDGDFETTAYFLKSLEKKLESYDFHRCSSSYLVNLNWVDGIKGGVVEIGGTELPMSRSMKNQFMLALTSALTR